MFLDGRPKLNSTVLLAEYDPLWPALFAREEGRIRTAFDNVDLEFVLEHIGSTSVPGLVAKPIIDMLMVVPDANDEGAYVAPLERVGYRLTIRETDWHDHRILKGPDTSVNLHVFPMGCAQIRRHLLFRDWLRTHPEDLALYERTKRELAGREWEYVQDYASAKNAVVLEIMERAVLATRTPSGDVELVSDRPKLNSTVHLAEYDPRWPALYAREEARIRTALGDGPRIEHVGSTSVPGIAAKPIIDILLVVPDTTDEAAYVPALSEAGYVLRFREPDWHQHRLFKGPDTDINLHVFSPGSEEIDRMLVFRDRLRTHPSDRAAYEQVKREFAGRTWEYVQDYADAKTVIVERLILRALSD